MKIRMRMYRHQSMLSLLINEEKALKLLMMKSCAKTKEMVSCYSAKKNIKTKFYFYMANIKDRHHRVTDMFDVDNFY